MFDPICTVPVPQTMQELDQAVQRYRASDSSGMELFCQWQAICEAALSQEFAEPQNDQVIGEDSY